MSLIPRPGPGQYVQVYPQPDGGIQVEVWRGEVQVSESRIGSIEVSPENLDEAVARLIQTIREQER
jgi:hypothetical protein